MSVVLWLLIGIVVVLAGIAVYDVTQKQHAILRNFPVVGHLRFILERFGPELRQYIVTSNDEERPFSRDQRRWVYASAKKENPYFGFGTDNRLEVDGYVFFRHAPFPQRDTQPAQVPVAKTLGGWRRRPGAFRPSSLTSVSAMSFGSLSGPAVQALNMGSSIVSCLHNTGEGGISEHHRHGGDLVFQLGTGYFGARDARGRFSLDVLRESIQGAPVRAIEVKLSQGAKPGLGGVLPGEKVTSEISAARGVPVGETVHSPAFHSEFDDVPSMVEFVEQIADATGLPVGIKSAVGQIDVWAELAEHMKHTGRGPDYIAVDGGEGGTGAAPLAFSDHMSLPFRDAFGVVFGAFAKVGLHNDVVFVGSGKLGFPAEAALAMAMGVDLIAVAREPMLAVGCIQAQRCHTGHCPTGVATQTRRLSRGLDPTDKAARLANYIVAMNTELVKLARAVGVEHPSLIDPTTIEVRDSGRGLVNAAEMYGLDPDWYGEARQQVLRQSLDSFS
ncbi:MAG: FMN-binding glutamate synthase family protein [Actinomycetia bacterium]|nr:FMN-binding glutamate synthase family protein [Actinomycetes bacterium]MCP4961150.1 FMN-binding glutamate synthase family protein [Actinomycetes bacterium]